MFKPSQIIKECYQLQKPLGRTAASRKTWLAKDLESNEQIVIKLLAFSPEMQWEELKLFEREAEVLQSLNHPRIPNYRDYFSLEKEEGGGWPWFALVQDYIPGLSFQELLERGHHFTELEIRTVATEVLEILIYLHELSPPVLHRDIKPSNLILGEDKNIYVVDFGAVQDKATVTGITFTVVGSSGYSPLEQFWGRAVAASDLYALGATLIHLLTGVSPADLPDRDFQIQFAHLVSINANLISWIEKMTAMNLEKRFSTARQALKALQELYWRQEERVPANFKKSDRSQTTSVKVYNKFKISKSPEFLEIQIPPFIEKKEPTKDVKKTTNYASDNKVMSATIMFIVAITLLVFLLLDVGVIPAQVILILLGILFLVGFILVGLTAETYIYFDRDRFKIENRLLGSTTQEKQGNTKEILGVLVERRAGSKGAVSYLVRLRTTRENYNINGLDENDSFILAQEIQDWLYQIKNR